MDYLSIFKTNLHDLQNPLDSLNSENPLKKSSPILTVLPELLVPLKAVRDIVLLSR
jgi:hypothetical protein